MPAIHEGLDSPNAQIPDFTWRYIMKLRGTFSSSLIALLLGLSTQANAAPPAFQWDDMTTAAAMGYCLAKHPYITGVARTHYVSPDGSVAADFTPDGYEIVVPWGIVGTVRRNYIRSRSTTVSDEGQFNSCATACKQYGVAEGVYGVPLHQLVPDGRGGVTHRTDGIGDIAVLAMPDHDFALYRTVIGGISSRANNWHESDVAQADLCCCQAKP